MWLGLHGVVPPTRLIRAAAIGGLRGDAPLGPGPGTTPEPSQRAQSSEHGSLTWLCSGPVSSPAGLRRWLPLHLLSNEGSLRVAAVPCYDMWAADKTLGVREVVIQRRAGWSGRPHRGPASEPRARHVRPARVGVRPPQGNWVMRWVVRLRSSPSAHAAPSSLAASSSKHSRPPLGTSGSGSCKHLI